MQVISRPLLQPLANQGCFVGSVIIQHQMDVEVSRNSAVYLLQEIER
jgi:hypothetical protein